MDFSDTKIQQYQDILDLLLPADGTSVSQAKIEKELRGEKSELAQSMRDLIGFGVLELVNTQQYARVRLHQESETTEEASRQMVLTDATQSSGEDYAWLAYCVKSDDPRQIRARRLFKEKEEAKRHLEQIAKTDSLAQVPVVSDVWCDRVGSYNSEFAVLRREPIFSVAENPFKSN